MARRPRAHVVHAKYLAGIFFAEKPTQWTGPVERRDPATYQRPSVIEIRLCTNPFCRSWTPKRYRDCVICGTILPAA